MDYSLMLASQGIKHWIEFDGDEFNLSLDEKDMALAHELIDIYQSENRGFQEETPVQGNLDLLLAPVLFLAIPILCYFLVGLYPAANWVYSRGNADARLILAGEWWRCLTAATLHADEMHFLGNLVSGYFILNLLNHRLGIGTIMFLATLGAASTNFLVALASGPQHVSIGYSTVVFCALGMLAAVETLQRPRRGDRSLRRLTPLISAFFVAVMVGLGENADVKAHFYGFAIGAGLGLASRFMPIDSKRPVFQTLMALASYGLFACAWFAALRT